MTEEELKAIPFHFVCSAAWEDEHTLTYESEDGRLGFCDHTPKRKNGDFGKGYRHWHIDGKVYKTKEKFTELLNSEGYSVERKAVKEVAYIAKKGSDADDDNTQTGGNGNTPGGELEG